MPKKKDIFKVAGVYTSIILGAGFASGQELSQFFVRHGNWGFAGLVLAGVIFSFVGFATLHICLTKNISSYNQFMETIAGPLLGKIIEPVAAAFMFVLFSAMLAAGGAALEEAAGLPTIAGAAAAAALCFLVFMSGIEGVVEINSVMAPIMVVGGIFIGVFSVLNKDVPAFLHTRSFLRESWAVSGVTYAAYNIITAISVLCSLRAFVSGRAVALWGGVIGGIVMTLLGVCMSIPLMAYAYAAPFELPLLHVVRRFGAAMEYFYLLVLIMAIFTTAVANGLALIEWFCGKFCIARGAHKLAVKISVTFLALLAARTGFSYLVAYVYPLFALFGVIEIILIMVCFFGSFKI
ncbi:MAG: hypothetical protein LBS62_13480 [Clostridiales bacterium]|nr:hypothetical protein [Clostridiales bacterium]